jgi:hypothetical protein
MLSSQLKCDIAAFNQSTSQVWHFSEFSDIGELLDRWREAQSVILFSGLHLSFFGLEKRVNVDCLFYVKKGNFLKLFN